MVNASAGSIAAILLVEDDASQARLMSHWLEAEGYSVAIVEDGNQAVQRISEGNLSLVISDVDLPGASGLNVLETAKNAGIATILVTAHPAVQLASEAIDRGVDAYLLKPLNRARLVKVVEGVMDKVPEVVAERTVLAVGIAPGDVEWGCGGSLLAMAADGCRIVQLVLDWPDPMSGDLAVYVHGDPMAFMPDVVGGGLVNGAVATGDIAEVLRRTLDQTHASVLFAPSPGQDSVLHARAGRAAQALVGAVPEVYGYANRGVAIGFAPRRFVDIQGVLDAKQRLVEPHYGGQVSGELEVAARFWGGVAGMEAVEAFEVLGQRIR